MRDSLCFDTKQSCVPLQWTPESVPGAFHPSKICWRPIHPVCWLSRLFTLHKSMHVFRPRFWGVSKQDKTKWVLSLSGLLNAAFNTLLQVKCHHLRPRIPSHKIKAFICFPFGLDFQTGQTFTEMAQTVQINHRSSEEGSLHYSGSDEYGSHSPALWKPLCTVYVSSVPVWDPSVLSKSFWRGISIP